jgi:hypothetical protein
LNRIHTRGSDRGPGGRDYGRCQQKDRRPSHNPRPRHLQFLEITAGQSLQPKTGRKSGTNPQSRNYSTLRDPSPQQMSRLRPDRQADAEFAPDAQNDNAEHAVSRIDTDITSYRSIDRLGLRTGGL